MQKYIHTCKIRILTTQNLVLFHRQICQLQRWKTTLRRDRFQRGMLHLTVASRVAAVDRDTIHLPRLYALWCGRSKCQHLDTKRKALVDGMQAPTKPTVLSCNSSTWSSDTGSTYVQFSAAFSHFLKHTAFYFNWYQNSFCKTYTAKPT